MFVGIPRKGKWFSPGIIESRQILAFTLLELLCTVAVIVTLASLLFPFQKSIMERGRQVACLGNLRNIGITSQRYLSENQNTFPSMLTWAEDLVASDPDLTPSFHCPSDTAIRANVERKLWRSYAMNPLIHNYFGWYPATPDAPPNTPTRSTSIHHPSKVFYLCENFQEGGTPFTINGYIGSISGGPGQNGKHHGKTTNLLFVDGHAENIKYADSESFVNSHLYNRE